MTEQALVSEVIALSSQADQALMRNNDIVQLFNLASNVQFINDAFIYVFEEQDWYDPKTYNEIDTRLSFLCSLALEDYAYLRVEPGEEPVYGGDCERYGLILNNEETNDSIPS